MINKSEVNSVTTSQENIEAIIDEVYDKKFLIELFVKYFGEDKRDRIEEKLGRTYNFVIPTDIQAYNLQKYFLQDIDYKDSAYKDVAETAKNMLYSSSKLNLNRLKKFKSMICVNQTLKALSRDEEEPFTLENVFDYDARELLFSKKELSGKGERYDEFMAKLFGIATEGFEGFESFETITKSLISNVAKIKGVTLNPELTLTDIQNKLSDLFDINALRTSIDSSMDSINQIFKTDFKNAKDFMKDSVYKQVYAKILDARIKFVRDYSGRSISPDEINAYHWTAFDKEEGLKNQGSKYPNGFTTTSFTSFKGSSLGDMVYFKTKNGMHPVIRVSLDDRTAYSTSIHEGGHALQMVEKNGVHYTGFSRPIHYKTFPFSAFNEFYNEFLTKRLTAMATKEHQTTIREKQNSAYDDGVSLLGEFFEAYENELKENVIDNAFEYAIDLFGIDKFVELGVLCESLRNIDNGTINNLLKELNVQNLHEAKMALRETSDIVREGSGIGEVIQKVNLVSTIRSIDQITAPLIAGKNQEKSIN